MHNGDSDLMAGGDKKSRDSSGPNPGSRPGGSGKTKKQPDWAQGLQKLYSSVVDEPLPDMFQDLLRKLDGDGRA